jgi:predicted small integral membrane protein
MSYLALFFMTGCIVVGGLIVWTYTKPGKKWLKEL